MVNLENKKAHNNLSVSVIIPVYNTERYLNQCINSVLNQTLENIEIICIDDCSTDSSYEIIQEYAKKDERIITLQNKESLGPATRNKGLEVAKGEYVCFVDSDDWIENETLKYSYEVAKENNLDLLLFKSRTYNETTKKFGKTDNYSHTIIKEFENKIFNYKDINPELLYKISVTPHGKLYRRSLLEKNHIRFMEGVIYEDNVFFNEIFLNSKRVSLIDKYFNNHRIHPSSVMNRNNEKTKSIIDVSERLLQILLKDEKLYDIYHETLFNKIFSNINLYIKIIEPELINDYYNYYKEFIERCIHYQVYEDLENTLNYKNLQSYYLALKSIDSNDSLIINNQNRIDLKYPIAVIINCKDLNTEDLNCIFRSLILQNIGFQFLEIYLVCDTKISEKVKEYNETFVNVHILNIAQKDYYLNVLSNIENDYVLFINHNINLNFIDDLFKKIRKGNLNLCLPSTETFLDEDIDPFYEEFLRQNIDKQDTLFSVENKLFKRDFINDKSMFIRKEEKSLELNPKIYFKNISEEFLIEYFLYLLEENQIDSFNNIIEILRNNFLNKKPPLKKKCFKNIKDFFNEVIAVYGFNEIIYDLNKDNKDFFDIVVMSINDQLIQNYQEKIKLDNPITIIVYIQDNPQNEVNNIINSLIRQSFGFSHIEILLVNHSKNINTSNYLKEYSEIFYNINLINIDYRKSEIEAYSIAEKSISNDYIMFTNKEHIFLNSAVKNIFKAIRKDNMNLVSGSIQENDSFLPEDNIYTKIIKNEFIKENNIKFQYYDNTIVFNPEIHKLNGILNIDVPIIKR